MVSCQKTVSDKLLPKQIVNNTTSAGSVFWCHKMQKNVSFATNTLMDSIFKLITSHCRHTIFAYAYNYKGFTCGHKYTDTIWISCRVFSLYLILQVDRDASVLCCSSAVTTGLRWEYIKQSMVFSTAHHYWHWLRPLQDGNLSAWLLIHPLVLMQLNK